MDFLNHYHPELAKYFNLEDGYYSTYISYILNILGLNSSIILFSKNKFHNIKITFKRTYEMDNNNDYDYSNIPDILLFYVNNFNDFSKYPEITLDFKDFGEEIIEINGVKFKLDCIILTDEDNTHAITGLTCNGSKYVYNGWWKEREISENPCNLMPFDWTTDTTNFCLNVKECSLPKDLDKGKLCYNFKNNTKIMVYVKIRDDKIEKIMKQIIKLNSVKISHYFDNLDIETIKKVLKTKFSILFDDNEDEIYLRRLIKHAFKRRNIINSISPEESLSIINDTTSIEHI